MRTHLTRLAAALALCFMAGTPAGAQQAPAVMIVGTVLDDESATPIEGAVVEILGQREILSRSVTDAEGAFRFTLPRHGGYRFGADRIGYGRTVTPTLYTDGHDTVAVEIRLNAEAVLLAPLEVTAWSPRARPSSVLSGFTERMRIGLGHFFTRADVERLSPTLASDLLGMVPGVHLRSSGRGLRREVYMSRTGGYCPAQIFVDGFLLNGRSRLTGDPGFTVDDAVSPESIEGIEVYRGLSSVPAEFLNADSRCGAVLIWTRRDR